MRLVDLDKHLSEYLEVARFDDLSLNGLQVEGKPEIKRVAFGVSACVELFHKAVAAGADALVVHHGLLWKGDWPSPVAGVLKGRLKTLLEAECSLFAFHLPLDAHPIVGNNAAAAKELGLRESAPFAEYRGIPIGIHGRLGAPMGREAFREKIEKYYGHAAHCVMGGAGTISTAGIVSGGAAKEVAAAVELNLDAYVTGEPSEPMTYYCREAGINFFAMGHYATERIGVRALAGELAERFGLETLFIEVENQA